MTCNLQNIYLKIIQNTSHTPCITKKHNNRRREEPKECWIIIWNCEDLLFITKGSLQIYIYISSCWYLWRYVPFHCTCVECNGMYNFFVSDIMYNFFLHSSTMLYHPSAWFFRCITKYMCKLYYPLASASPKKGLACLCNDNGTVIFLRLDNIHSLQM